MLSALEVRRDIDRALEARHGGALTVQQLSEISGPPFLRVSSLASCGRRLTYQFQGVQETTPSSESMLQMIQGDWGEDGMRKLLQESGYEFRDAQRELSYWHDGDEILRGHIDGLIGIDHGALGTTWRLWEMKMMSAYRFKKTSQTRQVAVTSPEYYAQMQAYMHLLNLDGEHIDGALFMAMAKDPSAANMGNRGPRLDPLYIEEVPYDPEFGEHLLERARNIYATARAGNLWPHERNPVRDWDCSPRFCPVWDHCQPDKSLQHVA